MQSLCGGLCLGAQFRIERDFEPARGLAVEYGAAGNRHVQHLFETHCLGAELDLEAPFVPELAPLVFHREGTPMTGNVSKYKPRRIFGQAMKLDHIELGGQPEPQRPQAQSPGYPEIPASLRGVNRIHLLVHESPFDREEVVFPHLLNVVQCRAAFAEREVCQRR
jgi:hypothetical protein